MSIKYSGVINNILSSNDGAFFDGLNKYLVRKNRKESCFGDIADERYILEPRLEVLKNCCFCSGRLLRTGSHN